MWETPAVVLISGIMAAGKSTVAELTAGLSAEAWHQLRLRYDLAADFRADTPRIGWRLDSSTQTPAETVDEILARAWRDGRSGKTGPCAR